MSLIFRERGHRRVAVFVFTQDVGKAGKTKLFVALARDRRACKALLVRQEVGYCPNLNDAARRVKGGSEFVALSIGQRLYASGCLGS